MTTQGGKLRVQLAGAFAIHSSTGLDRTPKGRKACAILAMLALAPEGKRARTWLQDKLWSTRAPEQGAASLRQSIYELRAALGDDRDVVVADKFNLSLDLSRCAVDLDNDASPPEAELLEGLDVGDEEFEDWLREQRARSRERRLHRNEPGARVAPPGSALQQAINAHAVLVLSRDPSDKSEASIVADGLLDSIAKTVVELGVAKVYDRRAPSEQHQAALENLKSHDALSLHTEFFDSETRKMVRLALLQLPESSLAWSSTLELPGKGEPAEDDARVKACINLVVNVAVDQFAKLNAGRSDKSLAQVLCQSGIVHLFRLGKANLDLADNFFTRAFDIEPRGIYLAWRAYVRTFLFAERHYTSFASRDAIEAEAFDFARRALEMEPYNSYVAALSAHVYSITRRSHAAAYELAERSIQLNHANPLGWACLGVAETYLGKTAEGLRHTLIAREIAGYAPYRYQLDAFSFIASAMAGDVDRAILLAEACHALAPIFAPPIRYLSALYAHKGQEELSLRMVEKLRVNEPDFSLSKLSDEHYPVAGLRRTTIISSLPKRQI